MLQFINGYLLYVIKHKFKFNDIKDICSLIEISKEIRYYKNSQKEIKYYKNSTIYILLLIINFIACDSKAHPRYNFIAIVRHFNVGILRRNFKIYNYNTCGKTRRKFN